MERRMGPIDAPEELGRRDVLKVMAAAAFALPVQATSQAVESCGPKHPGFRVFDATAYRGKPELARLGIRPLHIIGHQTIWPRGASPTTPPQPQLVQAEVDRLPDDDRPIVLDYEMFPQTGADDVVRGSIGQLDRIVSLYRRLAPRRGFGYFGVLPIPDYPRSQVRGSRAYRQWQRDNDRSAALERRLDFLFPCLYTRDPDRAEWLAMASASICEARRLSRKPIYPFLWPEYHDGNRLLGGTLIDAEFWALQLDTVYRLADGLVIWGGYNIQADRPRDWNERAPWWQVTRQFLGGIRDEL
jgi:hypothetical protein